MAGNVLGDGPQAGVLAPERHNVLKVVKKRNFVHVHVSDNLRDRNSRIVGVIVGTEQAFLFTRDCNK